MRGTPGVATVAGWGVLIYILLRTDFGCIGVQDRMHEGRKLTRRWSNLVELIESPIGSIMAEFTPSPIRIGVRVA